jgi:hypothetical protein
VTGPSSNFKLKSRRRQPRTRSLRERGDGGACGGVPWRGVTYRGVPSRVIACRGVPSRVVACRRRGVANAVAVTVAHTPFGAPSSPPTPTPLLCCVLGPSLSPSVSVGVCLTEPTAGAPRVRVYGGAGAGVRRAGLRPAPALPPVLPHVPRQLPRGQQGHQVRCQCVCVHACMFVGVLGCLGVRVCGCAGVWV